MKSIKTAFVVVVMLVVIYGAWVMINKKPLAPPGGMLDGSAFNLPKVEFPGSTPATPGTGSQFAGNSFGGTQALTPAPVQPGSPVPLSPPSNNAAGGFGTTNPAYGQPSPYPQSGGETSPYGASAYGAGGQIAGGGAPVVSADAYANSNSTPTPPATQPPANADAGWDNLRGNASAPSIYGGGAAASGNPPPVIDGPSVAEGAQPTGAIDSSAFLIAWRGAQDQLAKGELAGALETLSLWHDSEDVPAEMQSQLTELLDQLAGAVVYSTDHAIEPPHEVVQGETLESIASQLQVPWQLLANINGISDPTQVAPGTKLKVVRGPINAVIHLNKKELTLLAGPHYAGRFAIGLGNDPAPMTGEYVVREKAEEKTYYDNDARAIPPGEDANPYGPYWIGLQGRLGIHGAAPAPRSGQPRNSTGSINVSPDDARDLYAILSKESRVIIRQ